MASWTYPQHRHVLYAPYQSLSIIIEPRQRGHVRGSTLFIEAVLSEPAKEPCARAHGQVRTPDSQSRCLRACGGYVRSSAKAARTCHSNVYLSPREAPPDPRAPGCGRCDASTMHRTLRGTLHL
jgi:hypothetical protein